ncbi:MAG: aminotransferase class IV [Capnocytophaga sp.]|nr:aminotransferase class IV [Capnocytophaga sp.]
MQKFIETIKLNDGKIYNLDYHQQRVERTFLHFFKNAPILQLYKELDKLSLPSIGLFKVRLEYSENHCVIEVLPYSFRKINNFAFVSTTIEYPFKSVNRQALDAYKQQSKADEVIFVKNNYLTDTSYSNIVFYDGSHWVTPHTFLLNGTQRQRLLAENKIKESPISVKDVFHFEKIGLINAMNDLNDLTLTINSNLFM